MSRKSLIEILLIVAALSIIAIASFDPETNVDNPAGTGADTNTEAGTGEEVSAPGVEIMQPGGGDKIVQSGDLVSVNYIGTFTDGGTFDYAIEKPVEIKIGSGEVRGLDLGIIGMKVGEKRRLTISPELGYGDQEHGVIPANTTLVYDVTLLEIK